MSAMKNGLTPLTDIAAYDDFDEIIDVRSPGEFAEDHIPGSINCPVLDDAQRIEIGTLYKQHSPFAAKKLGAAHVAENIARHLRDTFHDRPKAWHPLVLCWRGGQRSGAMTHVLRRVGWDARQLQGGYKEYRRLVIDALTEWPRRLRFYVLCGATGSAKSRVLQALGRRGEQILDLEELARHKGSVLGVLPDSPQPGQKMFESQLLVALRHLDPERPVYVEAESRKIGAIHLPEALIGTLRAGTCLHIDATLPARVDFLLRDYDYFLRDPDWLNSRLDTLRHLQSRETITRWQDFVRAGAWQPLVRELLEQHYDPLYQRSQHQNFSGFASPQHFPADGLCPEEIEALAVRISQNTAAAP